MPRGLPHARGRSGERLLPSRVPAAEHGLRGCAGGFGICLHSCLWHGYLWDLEVCATIVGDCLEVDRAIASRDRTRLSAGVRIDAGMVSELRELVR